MATLPDNIFRKYDVRGIADVELTDEVVHHIARAYAAMVREEGGSCVAVGRDCRLSSPRIRDAVVDGLCSAGVDVLDLGMVPSPLLYFAVFERELDGGLQITGSHNPPEYNGIKVMLGERALFGEDIQRLRELVTYDGEPGSVSSWNPLPTYVDFLRENIAEVERPIRVVVDAGNGAAGPTAIAAYEALGIDIVPIHCEPDGNFPAHHPDPTLVENLEYLGEQVRKHSAELGIGFDGDGDRIGIVGAEGEIIWSDRLLVLLAEDVLRDEPGATILGEVKCSQVLFDAVEKFGGKPVMGQVGHSIMKSEMKRLSAPLAGELSGHIFYSHRFFGYDDAVYVGCRLLEILGQRDDTVTERLAWLPDLVSTPEMRIDCSDELKFAVVDEVSRQLASETDVITVDGVRAQWDNGWGLVRASNTQPAIVVRAEAATEVDCEAIAGKLQQEIRRARAAIVLRESE